MRASGVDPAQGELLVLLLVRFQKSQDFQLRVGLGGGAVVGGVNDEEEGNFVDFVRRGQR